MPDPVVEAINSMLDHIHTTDKRLDEMTCILRRLGEHVDSVKPLEIDWLDDCREATASTGKRAPVAAGADGE
jgi:serine O-acetyltransferase